eukprot:scaffold7236_cov69-Phaeocystis_antarctica.AAC.10
MLRAVATATSLSNEARPLTTRHRPVTQSSACIPERRSRTAKASALSGSSTCLRIVGAVNSNERHAPSTQTAAGRNSSPSGMKVGPWSRRSPSKQREGVPAPPSCTASLCLRRSKRWERGKGGHAALRKPREYNLKAARITMHTTRYLQHGPNSDVSTLPQIALLAHDL